MVVLLVVSALTFAVSLDSEVMPAKGSTQQIEPALAAGSPPPVQWGRTYGGYGVDMAYSVIQSSDGGYVLAGFSTSFAFPPETGIVTWLVKTDSSGNVLWNNTLSCFYSSTAQSVVQTGDGGFALAGSTGSPSTNNDFWLVMTDSSGNMLWNKTYGGSADDECHSIVQTGDGGFALVGWTDSSGAGNGDFWLVRTDSSGNMLWNKTYGGTSFDEAWSLVQTGDGGFALAGWTTSFGAGLTDFWLVRTDSSGSMLWNKTYGGSTDDICYSLVQASDGGYAIAGYRLSVGLDLSDIWLVKTDVSGNMLWNATYNQPFGAEAYAFSLVQTSDGGYAVAGGAHNPFPNDFDYVLVKFASDLTHDVAITNVAPAKSIVGQNYTLSMNVTAANQGNYAETFNVTTSANATAINQTQVTLTSMNSTTTTFTWNTTGFAYGNYTLSAYAWPVPGETNTANNNCTDGSITITIPGDINGDFRVSLSDLSLLAKAYGSTPGSQKWNANADINSDNRVSLSDLSILAKNYGKSVTP